MSTINVNTISNAAGSGAPNFPDGVQVAGNNVPTAGSFSNRNKIIKATIDGVEMFVPLDGGNRHYQEIMRQVEAGELVISEAE